MHEHSPTLPIHRNSLSFKRNSHRQTQTSYEQLGLTHHARASCMFLVALSGSGASIGSTSLTLEVNSMPWDAVPTQLMYELASKACHNGGVGGFASAISFRGGLIYADQFFFCHVIFFKCLSPQESYPGTVAERSDRNSGFLLDRAGLLERSVPFFNFRQTQTSCDLPRYVACVFSN